MSSRAYPHARTFTPTLPCRPPYPAARTSASYRTPRPCPSPSMHSPYLVELPAGRGGNELVVLLQNLLQTRVVQVHVPVHHRARVFMLVHVDAPWLTLVPMTAPSALTFSPSTLVPPTHPHLSRQLNLTPHPMPLPAPSPTLPSPPLPLHTYFPRPLAPPTPPPLSPPPHFSSLRYSSPSRRAMASQRSRTAGSDSAACPPSLEDTEDRRPAPPPPPPAPAALPPAATAAARELGPGPTAPGLGPEPEPEPPPPPPPAAAAAPPEVMPTTTSRSRARRPAAMCCRSVHGG